MTGRNCAVDRCVPVAATMTERPEPVEAGSHANGILEQLDNPNPGTENFPPLTLACAGELPAMFRYRLGTTVDRHRPTGLAVRNAVVRMQPNDTPGEWPKEQHSDGRGDIKAHVLCDMRMSRHMSGCMVTARPRYVTAGIYSPRPW